MVVGLGMKIVENVQKADIVIVITNRLADIGTLKAEVPAIIVALLNGRTDVDLPLLILQEAQEKTKTAIKRIKDPNTRAQAQVGLSLQKSVGSLRNIFHQKNTNIIGKITHIALFQAIQIIRGHAQDHLKTGEDINTKEKFYIKSNC